MVLRAIPVASHTAAIAPHPAASASAEAKRRRPRSSSIEPGASQRSAATSINNSVHTQQQNGNPPKAFSRFANISMLPK
jgi:hypothetical protein